MTFFKRLSGTFWSYLSPDKQDATRNVNGTPRTAPQRRKRGRPFGSKNNGFSDVVRQTKSMSPVARVDRWRLGSTPSEASRSRKRKAPMTPSSSNGRQRKVMRRYAIESEDEEESDDDVEAEGSEIAVSPHGEMDDEDDVNRSLSPGEDATQYDAEEGDTSLLVSHDEYQYQSPRRKKIISPTKETFDRGISTNELRADGWDDDHIVLVQKIAMRGYEPLLPYHWKMDWPFMPDELFAKDDDAFITAERGHIVQGSNALQALFGLGGWVRDRVSLNGKVTPEQQTKRMMQAYMEWAERDSGLDPKTTIPLLALECKPSHISASKLQENAKRKLQRLANRYRTAFGVRQSIEGSPVSRTSNILSYPLPTLYAIIASGTLIALVAYNPRDEQSEVTSIAFFQMRDNNYDVWNALALAIVVCHVRGVQIRIAEDTGLGLKSPDVVKEEVDDPDL